MRHPPRRRQFLWRTLAGHPNLRLTLLHWKAHLRDCASKLWLGPNAGQVSTYALFTILYRNGGCELDNLASPSAYEAAARLMACSVLRLVPRVARTPDPLADHINLTAQSYHAADIVRALGSMPPL